VTFQFAADDRAVVAAALDAAVPGSVELGALDYVERLLGALDHDPPHIWAAPAGSGARWLALGTWERHAWRLRIDEYQQVYARVAAGAATVDDQTVVFAHACEATYGDPSYGGNRDGAAWTRIGFAEPLFPPARDDR